MVKQNSEGPVHKYRPIDSLPTHKVFNQPPPLEDYNLFALDPILKEWIEREEVEWAAGLLNSFGERLGSREWLEAGTAANSNPPRLRSFDRFGQRVDEVDYHPSYHGFMELAIAHRVHSIAWGAPGPASHVVHAALLFLLSQVEAGVCCPVSMTHASVPAIQRDPDLFAEWGPRILSARYDRRFVPVSEKQGATIGMAMTEKQGGSDVRLNSTRAERLAGSDAYLLRGHKWFCSAPMSDAFLTLAQASKGLTCFLVPRWKPDGTRNRFFIQRLKDKLGNRSNASCEVELHDTWGLRLGQEGDGIRAIIPMVHQTRLDAAVAAASLMRQAVVQAVHHSAHRRAFGRLLRDQPLMLNVLADLALESEAATSMVMRVAQLFTSSGSSPERDALGRLLTAAAKFWLNKRAPLQVFEAMECLGGSGYVEESVMPRLYREAPLNSIWEGSGNVICLDVKRILSNCPEAGELLLAELHNASGLNKEFDESIESLKSRLMKPTEDAHLRLVTEQIAVIFQAATLLQWSPANVAEAFCASRLQPLCRGLGTLTDSRLWGEIVRRSWPPTEG